MSLKLSRNKVNHLTRLIVDYIENNEELDYAEDIGNIRMKVFHLIMDELRVFEDIEEGLNKLNPLLPPKTISPLDIFNPLRTLNSLP